jgi:intracellular septation protein
MFSAILFGGIMFKKGLVKYICGSLFELPEKAWIKLSYRWAIFFMTIAVLNEIIWRNFSDGVWIKFKVFGIIPLTIIFTMTQIPFLHKNKLEEINK